MLAKAPPVSRPAQATAKADLKGEQVMSDRRMGDMLKGYYDGLTATPPPERLKRLVEALETALERGELRRGSLS